MADPAGIGIIRAAFSTADQAKLANVPADTNTELANLAAADVSTATKTVLESGVKTVGTITMPTQANTTNGDVATIGGQDFTAWKSGGAPAAPYVDIRTLGTAQEVAAALVAVINATSACTVTAGTPTAGTFAWTAKSFGAGGNVVPSGTWLGRTGASAAITTLGQGPMNAMAPATRGVDGTVPVAQLPTADLPVSTAAQTALDLKLTGNVNNLLLGGAAASAQATLAILGTKTLAVPAAGSAWNALDFQASTLTLAAGGVAPSSLSLVYIAAPTITAPAPGYVIHTAATVTIAGPPVAAGGATITHALALHVLSGASSFEGHLYAGRTFGNGRITAVQSPGGLGATLGVYTGPPIKAGLSRDNTDATTFAYYNGTTGDTVLDAVFAGAKLQFDIAGVLGAALDNARNFVIGATAAGATAAKCLALSNSATAPTGSADLCHLYCADNGAGHATLAIFSEEVVAAVGVKTVTEVYPMFINGVLKYVALAA